MAIIQFGTSSQTKPWLTGNCLCKIRDLKQTTMSQCVVRKYFEADKLLCCFGFKSKPKKVLTDLSVFEGVNKHIG